jgi:hypothetical protein
LESGSSSFQSSQEKVIKVLGTKQLKQMLHIQSHCFKTDWQRIKAKLS